MIQRLFIDFLQKNKMILNEMPAFFIDLYFQNVFQDKKHI